MAYESGIDLSQLLTMTPEDLSPSTNKIAFPVMTALGSSEIMQSASASSVGLAATAKYSLRVYMANAANLSFSALDHFERCPRKFELDKLTTKLEKEGLETNAHFVYGHALAAGVQSYLAFQDKEKALTALVFAWNADLLLEDEKTNKSIWSCIDGFNRFVEIAPAIICEWEVATINGRPAIELSFCIDLENGYKYYGHIDLILRNRISGELMVLELKTSGSKVVDEATFKYSPQALGYSIVLDKIANDLNKSAQFYVYYLIYKSFTKEFVPMPFNKNFLDRANWLRTKIMQCQELDNYRKQNFFPRRHQACRDYNRRCEYFDTCNLSNRAVSAYGSIDEINFPDEPVEPEFKFKLSELIANQQKIIQINQG